jgi:hypothetical protein
MGLDLLIAHEVFKVTDDHTSPLVVNQIPAKHFRSPNSTADSTPLVLECHGTPGNKVLSSQDDLPLPSLSLMTTAQLKKENQIKDALEILLSMRQSCETAICTLNDVLLYDKIEGGTMVLEKRPVSVPELLTQAVKPFFVQARLNEIDLRICATSMDALQDSVLEVDVNKISQVIRNFVSNSLKFTSSHGTITVKAYRIEVGSYSLSLCLSLSLALHFFSRLHFSVGRHFSATQVTNRRIESSFSRHEELPRRKCRWISLESGSD